MLESSNEIVDIFSKQMFSSAFKLGSYFQQEVVEDLMAKVRAGVGGIMTRGAIDMLDELSEHHSKILTKLIMACL